MAVVLLFTGCVPDRAARETRERTDRLYAAAERAYAQRQDSEAMALFERLDREAERPQDRALARYRIGQLHTRAGRADDAARAFEAVERADDPGRASLAAFRRALIAYEHGDHADAERRLEALVDTFPDEAGADRAIKWRGLRYDGVGADPAAAREVVVWLSGVEARHGDRQVGDNAAWMRGFVLLYHLGDLGEARAAFRGLVQRWPDSPLVGPALWTLSAIHERQGLYEAAAGDCDALLGLYDETRYYFGRYRSSHVDDAALRGGWLRFHALKDFGAAAASFQGLLDRFPTSVHRDDAWWGLAMSRFEAGDRDRARRALRALLDEDAESRYAERARTLLDGGSGDGLRLRPDVGALPGALLDPDAKGNL